MSRRALLLCSLFFSMLRTDMHAQTLLKAADLQADAAVLRSAYEQMHPGLYRYNTPTEMDAHVRELNRRLDHDQTLAEAFLAFSRFTAEVRCGHTQLNPFNQSKAVVDALFKTPIRVPFYFIWLDRRMVVTRDLTPDHSLPAGTEVLAINGVPSGRILDTLLPIARADGANDNKRIAQLAVTGDSNFETFDLYFPLFFPQTSNAMRLQVILPHAKQAVTRMASALTYDQRAEALQQGKANTADPAAPLFEWRVLPDGAAYLRMPTWALFNSKWDWKPWLQEHLAALTQSSSPALIVDLRGNEGGNDVGNEILPFLIDAPLTVSPMRRLIRYRDAPIELVPALDTWDKSFLHWGKAAVDLAQPWPTAPPSVPYLQLIRDNDDAQGDVIKPAAHRFTGRVFVLVDASNSSATFQFAQSVQQHHLATLVGQTTGGSQRGINGGAFFFLRLPHSGLEADLPVIATFPLTPAPDAGVTPDVPVAPSVADIASGRDAALAAVDRLLSSAGAAARTPAPQPTQARPASNPTR